MKVKFKAGLLTDNAFVFTSVPEEGRCVCVYNKPQTYWNKYGLKQVAAEL